MRSSICAVELAYLTDTRQRVRFSNGCTQSTRGSLEPLSASPLQATRLSEPSPSPTLVAAGTADRGDPGSPVHPSCAASDATATAMASPRRAPRPPARERTLALGVPDGPTPDAIRPIRETIRANI